MTHIVMPNQPCQITLRTSLMLLLYAVVQCLHAQGFARQFPITSSPFQLGRVMLAPGGGLLVHYENTPAKTLIRYNADGTAQWARQYSPSLGADGYTPMSDGGVVISGSVDYYFGDTARYSHIRLGPGGDVLWGRRYMISGWPVSISQAQLTGAAIIVHDQEGSVFTVLDHGMGAASGPTVLKSDASGSLQWALDLKELGSTARPVIFADGQGGCYVAVLRNSMSGRGFTLYNLLADGSLGWRKKFEMTGDQAWFSGGVALSADGTLMVAGWMYGNPYLLRIDQNGSLDQALSYPAGPTQAIPPPTRLPTLQMPNGSIRFGERDVLTFFTNGTFDEYSYCPPEIYDMDNEQFELLHHIRDGDAEGVVVSGTMRTWNTPLTETSMGLVAARISWSSLGNSCPFGCSDMPTAEGIPLSNDLFTYLEEP